MVKVIARYVGYYGGKIHEVGEAFEMADEHYLGAGRACSWVEVVGDAPKIKSNQKEGGHKDKPKDEAGKGEQGKQETRGGRGLAPDREAKNMLAGKG